MEKVNMNFREVDFMEKILSELRKMNETIKEKLDSDDKEKLEKYAQDISDMREDNKCAWRP